MTAQPLYNNFDDAGFHKSGEAMKGSRSKIEKNGFYNGKGANKLPIVAGTVLFSAKSESLLLTTPDAAVLNGEQAVPVGIVINYGDHGSSRSEQERLLPADRKRWAAFNDLALKSRQPNVMAEGKIFCPTENLIEYGDDVYVRITVVNPLTEVLGALRNDSDGGNAILMPNLSVSSTPNKDPLGAIIHVNAFPMKKI